MRGLTFEWWDESGSSGSITVPQPSRWYLRWPLRLAAFIWSMVADIETRERECDICGVKGGHTPYCVRQAHR